MIGVVLAAGKASRLPNKPLLPIGDDSIAIESALRLCCEANCSTVHVVQSADRIVETVMRLRGHNDVRYVVQPHARGVPDALGRVPVQSGELLLVTFCDNVYPADEAHIVVWAAERYSRAAAARELKPPANGALDRWDERHDRWVGHTEVHLAGEAGYDLACRACLAGWYVLDADAVAMGEIDQSSVEFLNRVGAVPVRCAPQDWYDIGTPKSYRDFLRILLEAKR